MIKLTSRIGLLVSILASLSCGRDILNSRPHKIQAGQCPNGCPPGHLCQPNPEPKDLGEDGEGEGNADDGAGGYEEFVCVYQHNPFCSPCYTDEDCVDPWAAEIQHRCLAGQDPIQGAFCATFCGPDGGYCPADATCVEMDIDGETVALCRPEDEICLCSQWATERSASTYCSSRNDFGTCEGKRVCQGEGASACDAPQAALDICNDLDDDCDGTVDEDYPQKDQVCDGDDADLCAEGFHVCSDGALICSDTDSSHQEMCNEQDDDCDSAIDEDFLPGGVYDYTDLDGTEGLGKGQGCGVGACAHGMVICSEDSLGLTCDTGRLASEEVCDGIDSDCDGATDNVTPVPFADRTDGVCAGLHKLCSGAHGWTEPNYEDVGGYETVEVSCDGNDNDCDGSTDEGLTPPLAGQQQGVCESALAVCAGSSGWIEPNYADVPGYETDETRCDGEDNDCDASTDEDLIGDLADNQQGACAGALKECGGASGWVEPDYRDLPDYEVEEEACDGSDNDCDGFTDELEHMSIPAARVQAGVCAGALQVCAGEAGWIEPPYDAIPLFESAEVSCDGSDNDCDGTVDELADMDIPLADEQRGVCAGINKVCAGTAGWQEPNYGASPYHEVVEATCDGRDNDCDGDVDESLSPPLADLQLGVCAGSRKVCEGDSGWQEPSYQDSIPTFRSQDELCDGLDNDCDGPVDEDVSAPLNPNQNGACTGSQQRCDGSGGWQPDYSGVATYGQAETPNASFFDENCDGIDGDVLGAVFVAPWGADNPVCNMAEPCHTVSFGIDRAAASGLWHVYVAAGHYDEVLEIDGESVEIYGGYDHSWQRADRGVAGHEVTIEGGRDAIDGQYVTARVRNVSVTLADVNLVGPDSLGTATGGQGLSSYVVHGVSATMELQRVTVIQGNGANGARGSDGDNASSSRPSRAGRGGNSDDPLVDCDNTSRGGGGSAGVNSSCHGRSDGGGGGRGGTMDRNCSFCWPWECDGFWTATPGDAGGNGAVWQSDSYGYRGGGGGTCSTGGGGRDGLVANGGAGPAGSGGRLMGNYWYGHDGGQGGLGEHGGGAGGGGGSGGCDDGKDAYGSGGGAGGAGGCRAPSRAGGGEGAGGSFGVFGVNATVLVYDSSFVRGNGGRGGAGGTGGRGQSGGLGGDGGSGEGGAGGGGSGGSGGHGGHGAGGGGGAGGLSYGIYGHNTSVVHGGNIFTAGSAGSGGGGGASAPSAPVGERDGVPGQGGGSGRRGSVGACSSAGSCN